MNAMPQPLSHYTNQEQQTAHELFEEHYEMLLKIARQRRRRHGAGETLRTTVLVHEAFLRLGKKEFVDADHFLRSSALAMRHVIVDNARRKLAARRGGGGVLEPINDDLPEFREGPQEIVQIADLLERLGDENSRWLRIVDARYFAGMTEDETAAMLDLSSRTVRRDWKEARSWIRQQV